MSVPASARLEVTQKDGNRRDLSLAMAQARVRAHWDYLADGEFRQDWPQCASGNVPVEAFRFDAVREAMSSMILTL